jgi:hypothetical protein
MGVAVTTIRRAHRRRFFLDTDELARRMGWAWLAVAFVALMVRCVEVLP